MGLYELILSAKYYKTGIITYSGNIEMDESGLFNDQQIHLNTKNTSKLFSQDISLYGKIGNFKLLGIDDESMVIFVVNPGAKHPFEAHVVKKEEDSKKKTLIESAKYYSGIVISADFPIGLADVILKDGKIINESIFDKYARYASKQRLFTYSAFSTNIILNNLDTNSIFSIVK